MNRDEDAWANSVREQTDCYYMCVNWSTMCLSWIYIFTLRLAPFTPLCHTMEKAKSSHCALLRINIPRQSSSYFKNIFRKITLFFQRLSINPIYIIHSPLFKEKETVSRNLLTFGFFVKGSCLVPCFLT